MKIIKLLPLFLLNVLYVNGMEHRKLTNVERANSSPSVLQTNSNEDPDALRKQLLNVRTQELILRKQKLELERDKLELERDKFEWKKSIIKLVKKQIEKGADVTCKMGDIDIQVMQQLKY